MITMDRKGIAWVGNIYQKFETMCLEVEEMMFEDTVKYVENQMVNVGESVKKFYSDVIQEILPPPPADDADQTVISDMPEQKYFEVEAFKNLHLNKNSTPTSHLNEEHANSDPAKTTKDSDVIHASISDRLHGTGKFCTSANAKCMKPDYFDSFPKELLSQRNLEKKKLPPSKSPAKISRRKGVCSALSSIDELNKGHEVSCHDATKLSSIELSKADFEPHSYHEIENANEQIAFASNSSSSMAVCDKSTSERTHTITVSSVNLTEESTGSSDEEICCKEFSDHPGFEMLAILLLFSYFVLLLYWFMAYFSRRNEWCFCARETEAVAGSDEETQQEGNKLQLDESCVVVSKDDCHCISQVGPNSRPSKNKIRQAFSSRRKSARKQEYERLVVLHESSTTNNHVCRKCNFPTSAVIHPRKAVLPETCESEWEIL